MPRTWLITGCSSGFGRQLAITAAQNNDTVIATSRGPTKLSDLIPLGILPKALDPCASDEQVTSAIADIESTIGPIDILVNNAGYLLEGAIEECTHAEILAQFDVNVFSQMRVLRAVLPFMRKRRAGVVANLGSIGGWGGGPAAGLYCASKAAVAIYTEALRFELAPLGIDVTCIEPGYFRTDFLVGGHKVVARNRIDDLHVGTKEYRDALVAYNHRQPGDPVKGAQVIVEALTKSGRCEGRVLPPRLALGRDAIAIIGASLQQEREMLESWGEIIGSTDYDDVEG